MKGGGWERTDRWRRRHNNKKPLTQSKRDKAEEGHKGKRDRGKRVQGVKKGGVRENCTEWRRKGERKN